MLQIKRLFELLSSDFIKKAPTAVVEKERQKLVAYQESANELQKQLKSY